MPIRWLDYFWGVLLRASRRIRGTRHDAPGLQTRSVRAAVERRLGAFGIPNIINDYPAPARDMVRHVLRQMRTEGLVQVDGRGRGAKWRAVLARLALSVTCALAQVRFPSACRTDSARTRALLTSNRMPSSPTSLPSAVCCACRVRRPRGGGSTCNTGDRFTSGQRKGWRCPSLPTEGRPGNVPHLLVVEIDAHACALSQVGGLGNAAKRAQEELRKKQAAAAAGPPNRDRVARVTSRILKR